MTRRMNHMWVYMATVVMVAVLREGCESSTIRPSLIGLVHAQEIQKQLEIIESILRKFSNASDCSTLNRTKEEGVAEEDAANEDTEVESEPEDVTLTHEDQEEKEEDNGKDEENEKEDMEEDECDYEKMNPDHTMMLPPNDNCKVKDTGITEEEKELILKLHNELRAKVAEGNESRGDPGPQPSAANMRQLVWNDELAEVAQAWAVQCPSGHDDEKKRRLCSRKYRTGQNINYYWGVEDEGPQWEKAIENWYNEVIDVDAQVAAAFVPHSTKKIGHYTQLIWGTSEEIGCGIVYYGTERKGFYFNNSITHVCNYGPAGNVLNRPFYELGPAVTNCPGNVSTEYPALCISSVS